MRSGCPHELQSSHLSLSAGRRIQRASPHCVLEMPVLAEERIVRRVLYRHARHARHAHEQPRTSQNRKVPSMKAPSYEPRRIAFLARAMFLVERPEGVGVAELVKTLKAPESSARRFMRASVEAGEIVDRGKHARYFVSVAAADAYSNLHAAESIKFVFKALPKRGAGKPSNWNDATPDTTNAKFTVCFCGKDRRFEVSPDYVGPFSLAGIGRDVETGRPWSAS